MTMRELRDEAARVLLPLADLAAPVAAGADPPWDQLIRIRDHEIERAAACPASLAFEVDFAGWRSLFARRQLAHDVLERMRKGATLDPASLARAAVDQRARDSTTSLGRWLNELDAGGRTAVIRDVTSFVVAARGELRWPPADGTRFGRAFTWDLPGRAVRLEAAVDAITGSAKTILVLATALDDDAGERLDLAWPAFVAALATGERPASVSRIDLVSGERRRVPVTDDVLDAGLTAAAAALEAAVAARFTAPAEARPGPLCLVCPGQPGCGPGASWVLARTRHFSRGQ